MKPFAIVFPGQGSQSVGMLDAWGDDPVVAETVREAGLTPWSASGTADRQAWVADAADEGWFGERVEPGFARSADWRLEADRILAHTRDSEKER